MYLIDSLPDYFFEVAAASTGKYHPKYAQGEGGLVRHTKAAVKIAYELLADPAIGNKYTDDETLKLDFYFNFFFTMFFSLTSPLYNKLVKEEIITDGISCGLTKINNYAVISLGTHSSKLDRLKEEIIRTIKELKDFDEEKFELDKKQTILGIILREENIGSTVMPFVNNIIMYNCDYPDRVEQIMSYTYEDFVNTIKNLDFNNYSVGVIKNKE